MGRGARTERKRIDLIVKEVEVVDVSRARMGERIKEELVVFSTMRCCYIWVFEI